MEQKEEKIRGFAVKRKRAAPHLAQRLHALNTDAAGHPAGKEMSALLSRLVERYEIPLGMPLQKMLEAESSGPSIHPGHVQPGDHRSGDRQRLEATQPQEMQHGADVSPETLEAGFEAWWRFFPLFLENFAKGREEALSRAALAYQPQASLEPVDLEQLELQKKAAESILSGTRWMTAADVARETNRSRSNPNALANRWKKEGRVFAIKYEGVERYPRYAFDKQLEPLPVMAEILTGFGDKADPWAIAAWFESTNAWLQAKRPREMLSEPEKVVAALKRRKGWMHG